MMGIGVTLLVTGIALVVQAAPKVVKRDVNELVSPCPDVFRYDEFQYISDSWYGVVALRLVAHGHALRLDITLDKPANLLGNWEGEVRTTNNINFTILNQTRDLVPGPTIPIPLFVTYTKGQTAPQIVTIKLNHVQICPGKKKVSSGTGDETTTSSTTTTTTQLITPDIKVSTPSIRTVTSPIIPPDVDGWITRDLGSANTTPKLLQVQIPPIFIEKELASPQCGKVDMQVRPLVTKGQDTVRGQWPWHVALFLYDGNKWSYRCGASLISRRSVVTAAHCVTGEAPGRPVDTAYLVVYLGKFKRALGNEEGMQGKQVMKVVVHPMYDTSNYYADIAVLTLTTRAEYTTYVQPVCLWDKTRVDFSYVDTRAGEVVGWGIDETGYRNGTSVCNGDSGGGMVFSDVLPDGSLRWSLRGIVSVSVAKNRKRGDVCDTMHYVVFTDVAMYLPFINGAMLD